MVVKLLTGTSTSPVIDGVSRFGPRENKVGNNVGRIELLVWDADG